ncbi:hypothetical protein G6F22_020120 [Rhizopus arrhizus]|nr:hypothetical protein G6F22_020120 [Rhizopus arrhizus]
MLRRTRPGGAVSQAIGLRTRRVDDLLHRIEGAVGPHDQRIADHAHQCHGREILDGVIAQRFDEERIDGMRGDGAAHQRVAVRLRAGHQLRADDAGHPRLVLDNHRLSQSGTHEWSSPARPARQPGRGPGKPSTPPPPRRSG